MRSRMMGLTLAAFTAATGFAGPAAYAQTADAIGAAIEVVDKVTAELNRAERPLAKDDGVFRNELISVSEVGRSEIVLADETKLALGPGAKLTLDKFVYDPDKANGSIVLNMTRGAFRFITGVAAKPTYSIRTPTASITVRGTIFDVYVEEGGAIWMLLHEGRVQVCNDRGQCRTLDDPCRLVRVDGGGGVGNPGNWNGLRNDRDIDFDTAFPFIAEPPTFDSEPRYERASIEAGRCGGGGITPRKTQRAEPRDPPKPGKARKSETKKVTAPKPATKVKVVREEPTKKKYEEPKKKKKDKDSDSAAAAKAIGIAIGIGLSVAGSKGGNKSGNKGGGSYGGQKSGYGGMKSEPR